MKEGLRFECTGCGKCCTGAPGYVWVTLEEITQIADFLHLPVEEFTKKYVRQVGERYSLIELGPEMGHDCVFLQEKKRCQIYPVRPKQCQTYPFWKENLTSMAAWKRAAKECEGITID